MKTWEYKLFDSTQAASGNPEDVETLLNDLGSEGWEVVNVKLGSFAKMISCSGLAKREKM